MSAFRKGRYPLAIGSAPIDSSRRVLFALLAKKDFELSCALAECREAAIPGRIGDNTDAAVNLNKSKYLRSPFSGYPQSWIKSIVEDTYYWGPVFKTRHPLRKVAICSNALSV
jgi:hypothetical protein